MRKLDLPEVASDRKTFGGCALLIEQDAETHLNFAGVVAVNDMVDIRLPEPVGIHSGFSSPH
jgi:hypothetical protein